MPGRSSNKAVTVPDCDWGGFLNLHRVEMLNWLGNASTKQLRALLADKVVEADYEAFRDDGKSTAQELCDIYINGYKSTPIMKMSRGDCNKELMELWNEYNYDKDREAPDDQDATGG